MTVKQMDLLRKQIEAMELDGPARGAFYALLDAACTIAIGSHLDSCEAFRARAYKGQVSEARTAIERALFELTGGKDGREDP